MSTRAIIHIYDELDGFNIYVHSDGWPDNIIPNIKQATKYSWELPRFEASEFATALIKVLKQQPWWVYLMNSTERISDVNYYYEILKEEWNLEIKVTHLKEL